MFPPIEVTSQLEVREIGRMNETKYHYTGKQRQGQPDLLISCG
jgi:hypothetical protein